MKKTGSFFIFFIINPAYFSRKCNKFETDDNSAYFQRIILKKFAGDRFSECQNRTIRAFFAYNPGLATGVPRMIIFPIFAPQESPFFLCKEKFYSYFSHSSCVPCPLHPRQEGEVSLPSAVSLLRQRTNSP